MGMSLTDLFGLFLPLLTYLVWKKDYRQYSKKFILNSLIKGFLLYIP